MLQAVQNRRGLSVAVRNVTGCTEQKGAECCSKKCYRLYRTEWGLSVAVRNVTAVQNSRGLSDAVRNVTGCTEQNGG